MIHKLKLETKEGKIIVLPYESERLRDEEYAGIIDNMMFYWESNGDSRELLELKSIEKVDDDSEKYAYIIVIKYNKYDDEYGYIYEQEVVVVPTVFDTYEEARVAIKDEDIVKERDYWERDASIESIILKTNKVAEKS